MHDRRIDGVTHVFGNHGALVMNAMTWYDHSTGSVWSQPWGRAIDGPYKGIELFLLPSQVTTWGNWVASHPETLVMTNMSDRLGNLRRQEFSPEFVLGLLLEDHAKAYYYNDVIRHGVVNDWLGEVPIVVWAQDEAINAFVRQVEDQLLTFQDQDGMVSDEGTGSTWDLSRGLATEGTLQGQGLQQVPGLTAFDWAWRDFFPQSEFYSP